jgi:hypothetical protein
MTLKPATIAVRRKPLRASSTVEDITDTARLVLENPWWNPSWLRPVGVAVCACAVAVKAIAPPGAVQDVAAQVVDSCIVLGLASVGVSGISEQKKK